MRTILCFVVAAACLTLLPKPAPGQDKPKLQSINGFMFKGVFTELDPASQGRRLSLADIEAPLRRQIDRLEQYPEPHGPDREDEGPDRRASRSARRDPPHAAAQYNGKRGLHHVLLCVQLNGLVVAGSGDQLLLIRPETRRERALLERHLESRTRFCRSGFSGWATSGQTRSLPSIKDKLGTKAGRADPRSRSRTS